ncbi:MAG TPA: restriction endonuclease subunit S [Gammaproteobacteria bacterium]|nr:restriction endonuclease subunit S [Chromatiaceae bacterium]HPE80753.1 restriction endonuclease subunit S [Gammaproteobacteria bacterium]
MTAKPATNSLLPDEWCEAVLGEVAESMKNGLYKKDEAYADDGIPCLRMYNIDAGRIVWRDVKRMRLTEAELADYELLPGDLLVNRVNSRELVGKTALIPGGMERSVFESKNIRLRLDKARVVPAFINYQLLAFGNRYFDSNAQQVVGMASVSQKQLANFPIVLAPLEQQREIVAEIEKQFSRLDEAVANLKRVKANLKRYKAAVLKAAVEGKLTEEWRKAHPDVEPASKLLDRILAERRAKWEEAELAKMEAKGKAPKNAKWKAKYKEPVAPDNVDLPELPEGWAWASADQVCGSVRDGTHDTPAYVDAGVPLITSKNLTDDGIDFDRVKFISEEDHLEISRRSGVEPGDVLFAMIGTVGNPCEIKTDVQFSIKNVGLFKRNAEFLDSAYLCNWLASPQFDRWLGPRLKGTTQKFAPLGLLRAIPIPLMSVDEQQRITMEVERRLSLIREAVSQVDANERRSVRLRQSILAAALSGSLSSEYLSLPKLAVS